MIRSIKFVIEFLITYVMALISANVAILSILIVREFFDENTSFKPLLGTMVLLPYVIIKFGTVTTLVPVFLFYVLSRLISLKAINCLSINVVMTAWTTYAVGNMIGADEPHGSFNAIVANHFSLLMNFILPGCLAGSIVFHLREKKSNRAENQPPASMYDDVEGRRRALLKRVATFRIRGFL